jgi:hypothetical protein
MINVESAPVFRGNAIAAPQARPNSTAAAGTALPRSSIHDDELAWRRGRDAHTRAARDEARAMPSLERDYEERNPWLLNVGVDPAMGPRVPHGASRTWFAASACHKHNICGSPKFVAEKLASCGPRYQDWIRLAP